MAGMMVILLRFTIGLQNAIVTKISNLSLTFEMLRRDSSSAAVLPRTISTFGIL